MGWPMKDGLFERPSFMRICVSKKTNVTTHLKSRPKIIKSNHNYLNSWIFDCGATHTITFDSCDILSIDPTTHTHIKIANDDIVCVDREGPIAISSCLKLNDGLVIPNFPYKLLFISQLRKELNCTVLITAHGCVVQDAYTQKIICHGTKSGG